MSKSKPKILKYGGKKQAFKKEKLIKTLIRAGASEMLAEKIAQKILSQIKKTTNTKQIYALAKKYLCQSNPIIAARYSLRQAIFRLGPAGYDFEKYIMLLFREYGYKTYLPNTLEGKCVPQEVDVIAEKNEETIMMECKLRKSVTLNVNLKDVMSNWARLIDLQEGAGLGKCVKIDKTWIVTNSRFSQDAYKYGICKNMRMLSWNTPLEKPLPAYIDSKNLYPVTVLLSIRRHHLKAFSKHRILLLQELCNYGLTELSRLTKINKNQLMPVLKEAEQVLSFVPVK